MIVGACLTVAVAAVWLAVLGFARLRTPLDRLHAATFVSAGAGFALVAASLAADGISNQTASVLFAVVLNLVTSAATAIAIGRALRLRGSVPEAE